MPNTSKTNGPTPNIRRQGQTAVRSFGQDPNTPHGTAVAKEKPRDLKP